MKFTKEEKEQYTKLYRKNLHLVTQQLDNQEAYFLELILFAAMHEYEDIPENHRAQLPVAKASVPWRADKKLYQRVQDTAHLFAKNEIKEARRAKA